VIAVFAESSRDRDKGDTKATERCDTTDNSVNEIGCRRRQKSDDDDLHGYRELFPALLGEEDEELCTTQPHGRKGRRDDGIILAEIRVCVVHQANN
jgi:hypothetical protein